LKRIGISPEGGRPRSVDGSKPDPPELGRGRADAGEAGAAGAVETAAGVGDAAGAGTGLADPPDGDIIAEGSGEAGVAA